MIAMWYAIVSFMLIVYVVLDGRNFGAGNASLVCRQDAGGTPAGDCRDRAALVVA